jgi:hypothetical protein
MRTFVIPALFVLITLCGYSQKYICLAKKADSKEWGYINEKGDWAIQPRAGKCMEFSSGLAVVLPAGSKQYAFINTKGELVNTEETAFKLMEIFGFGVKGFNNGMVAIKVGEQWGFLNTSGKLAVPIKYDKVTEFYEGYAGAEAGGQFFVLSSTGTAVPIADSKTKDVKHFSDGLAPYYTTDKKSGYVDTKGQVVIPATFHSVGYFVGGLAWAKLPEGKVGFINKKGEWVIQPQFDAAKEFDAQSKMARVKIGEQWSYVSATGENLNMTLESYGDFVEGLCYGKQGGLVGFFDKKGIWIIKPQFDAVRDFKNGFAAAKQGESWGVIDKTGKWIIQPSFDGIRDMESVK